MKRAQQRRNIPGPGEFADLNLRALQVFVAVEETGFMSEAAQRLSASRSGVSQQISNLERIVGTRLFDRTARPLALTPAGLMLRRHARRILEAVSEARTDMMELSLSSLEALHLGIIDDLDASITPALVTHLRSLFPHCRFEANSGRSDGLMQSLLKREIDLAVTGLVPEDPLAFDDYPILREPFILAAARGAMRPHDDLGRQMEGLPFVAYHPSMPISRAITQHLRRLRLDLHSPYAFDASRSVFAMVKQTGGWTITTPLCVLDSVRAPSELECLRLPFAGLTRTIRLVARREELGHLPKRLADLCRRLIGERLASQVVPGAMACRGVHRSRRRRQPAQAGGRIRSRGRRILKRARMALSVAGSRYSG